MSLKCVSMCEYAVSVCMVSVCSECNEAVRGSLVSGEILCKGSCASKYSDVVPYVLIPLTLGYFLT